MKHSFHGGSLDKEHCLECGYTQVSHTKDAICEACGLTSEAEFYPDTKHPRKMLLCLTCYEREKMTMKVVTGKTNPTEQVEQIGDRFHQSAFQVRTPSEYFNANIPAIMDIRKAIEADDTIPANMKRYEEAKQVKIRLNHLKHSLLELDKQRSTLDNEQRETRVFLNHLMKELSEEKQKELGLQYPDYKQEKAPKKVTVPSVKKFDKNAIKAAALANGIPEHILQGVVVAKKCSIEQAVKEYKILMGE
jgi:rhodanese-related sulfurtransferase